MKDLFEAIRGLAPSEAWSKGVTLARGNAVTLESRDDEEIVLRVFVPGSALSPRIGLYPRDGDWECDCGSPLEACEHVAAAVIALRQGLKPGAAGSAGRSPVVYRFTRTRAGLLFERGVEEKQGFRAIDVPLEAIASGRFSGPAFEASPEDLEIDRALRGKYRGPLDREAVARIFRALGRSKRITLDGKPVVVSAEPVVRPVILEDTAGGGFLLQLAEQGDASETFRNGIALVGERLRPVEEPALTGREWEELSRGRIYRAGEVAELVGEVLPSLKKRAPLEIRTHRLPGAVREPPRLSFLLKRAGERLYVLARVVYGDPPRARVEGDRLVSLGGEIPLRDPEAERVLEERLRNEMGLTFGRGEELETEAAVELVGKLDGLESLVEGEGRQEFRLHGDLVGRLSIEGDDFGVSFVTGGRRRADPGVVLRHFREGHSLVPLLDGGFARLPLDFLERYADEIEDLLAARNAAGRLPKASLPELARLAEELDAPPPPGLEELKAVLEEDLSSLPRAPIPPSLRAQLRDYQKTGVDWLFFLRRAGLGALLADDMGLGKTLQALAVLDGNSNSKSLVVAPTSVLQNWMDEAHRFRPELRLCLYHGRGRLLDAEASVIVTSHALLRQDEEALAAVAWDTVVIDEAQVIRNPETELARVVYRLDAKFRLSLTGTPIENRLVDLWSQFHFLNPGFLGGLSSFEQRFVRPVERGAREPLQRLRKRIRPFFLRRLKSEVAPELPPRTEMTLRAELGEGERELYDAVRLAARRDVVAKLATEGGSVLEALEALLRLRQATCHPSLLPGHEAPTSAKTEVLLDALETATAEGHKSLVFSQWTSMLDLLEPRLAERGYRWVRLDGSTRDRAAVVERFQRGPDVSVFLISLKAGGTGLNLTAADHVFLFDPWWNPAVEEQAFDRAHRIGQGKPVFVYRLVASDTVEERILALQDEKRALAELAAAAPAPSLTRDDLLRLLD